MIRFIFGVLLVFVVGSLLALGLLVYIVVADEGSIWPWILICGLLILAGIYLMIK